MLLELTELDMIILLQARANEIAALERELSQWQTRALKAEGELFQLQKKTHLPTELEARYR